MWYSRYILLVSGIFSVLISSLVSAIPLGFYNQGEVSALYPTFITPAAFTFSIWGLIYLTWIAYGIYEAFFAKTSLDSKNAYLLASAQIISSFWLIPSQYLYIATSLIVMYVVLYILSLNFVLSRNENKYFKYMLDLFLGWIIVASLANTHLFLVAKDMYFSPLVLTVLSLVGGTFVVLYLYKKYLSVIPSFVLIWALFGIIFSDKPAVIDQVSALCILTIVGVLVVSNEKLLNRIMRKSNLENPQK
ncbi:hypothetical protein GW846_03995 [Candidatus Gracilibacteria bacterium]|nr:hypothetical protein [Candidatus Gracilibacteria bacterium]